MSETTPQDHGAPPEARPEPGQGSGTGRFRAGMVRIAVWTIAILALLVWLALGSVSAVWYRYNAFSQRVTRQDEQRGIVEIWTDWLNNLPEGAGEWALSAVFVGAIAVVIATVIGGAWLLLVSPEHLNPRAAHSRRR